MARTPPSCAAGRASAHGGQRYLPQTPIRLTALLHCSGFMPLFHWQHSLSTRWRSSIRPTSRACCCPRESGHGRASVLNRLKLACAAAARRQQLRVLTPNVAFALPRCTHFVSYTRGLPHGSTVKITQAPRVNPFEKGAFTGMHLLAVPSTHAHMRCTAFPSTLVCSMPQP